MPSGKLDGLFVFVMLVLRSFVSLSHSFPEALDCGLLFYDVGCHICDYNLSSMCIVGIPLVLLPPIMFVLIDCYSACARVAQASKLGTLVCLPAGRSCNYPLSTRSVSSLLVIVKISGAHIH